MYAVVRLLLPLLLLLGASIPVEGAANTRYEGFEAGTVPPQWTTTAPSKLAVVKAGNDARYEGKYALSWTYQGGTLKHQADAYFDHVDLYVRQGLFATTTACLRVALGSRVTYVDFTPTDGWKRVTLDAEATTTLQLSSCSQSSGVFLIDAVTTYSREKEATATFLNKDHVLKVPGSNMTQDTSVDTPPLLAQIAVIPEAPRDTASVSFRYNHTYAGETLGPARAPVPLTGNTRWMDSGTGVSIALGDREIAFVPYVGQAWVILA